MGLCSTGDIPSNPVILQHDTFYCQNRMLHSFQIYLQKKKNNKKNKELQFKTGLFLKHCFDIFEDNEMKAKVFVVSF